MCRWKSPRARHLWEANSSARIRAISRQVLATRSERRRMELLTGLRGVGVPMASAILTLLDPRRYGVLDIRAWQLLFAIRSVGANRRGQGFTIAQWEQYLDALRSPRASPAHDRPRHRVHAVSLPPEVPAGTALRAAQANAP